MFLGAQACVVAAVKKNAYAPVPAQRTLSAVEQACLAAPQVAPGHVDDKPCLAEPDSEIYALWAASHRCLRHIYLEDNADDPVVDALLEKLKTPSPIADHATALRETLLQARTRARTLFLLGPLIRALEIAFFEARFDHAQKVWRGIDEEACRHAHEVWRAFSPEVQATHPSFVVLIEPIGHDPLSSFLSLCPAPR